MGTKLSRALSIDGRQEQAANGKTVGDPSNNSRSVSRGRDFASPGRGGLGTDVNIDGDAPRGREALISTGRGGAGNIMRSPSRDIGPESRGHVNSDNIAARALSTGRGGAGNIRSTSRDGRADSRISSILPDQATEYEREVLQKYADARDEVHVTGRGGLGNISGSRSRSRSKGPGLHSSGRGGAGNIMHGLGDPEIAEILDDKERLKHVHADGIHSTGRGGIANVTTAHGPGIEKVQHLEAPFQSSGRGGAGNIRSRSASREPGSRNPSKDKHPVSHLWNKISHPHPHGHSPDPAAIQEVPGKEGRE